LIAGARLFSVGEGTGPSPTENGASAVGRKR
jgi:hypothetical protein